MYTDATQWSRIRERLLDKGESLRSVSLSEGIARPTLRRILASELPSRYRRVSASLSPAQDSFIQHLKQLVSENRTAAPTERASVRAMHAHLEGLGFDASYRVVLHRAHRIRRQDVNDALDVCSQVEQLDDRDAARLLRALCHPRGRGVLDEDKLSRHLAELRATSPETTVSRAQAKWGQWVAQMERTHSNHASPADPSRRELLASLEATSRLLRQRSLCVLAHRDGFSIRQIATMTSVSRTSIRRYLAAYRDGGCAQLISRKPMAKMADDPKLKEALFSLLHEPPSLSGVNRATWKLEDVRRVLTGRGFTVGASVIRQVIRAGGFRWKSAKVVLTSHDPKYREKLTHIQDILADLGQDERFFSIDEFGPFAVKMKAGRALTPPGVQPTVPQWQTSKGCLILTAALELSTNQVTHFYSTANNTQEMMRMATALVAQYGSASKLYLSWDTASWHMSKKLNAFVEDHNKTAASRHEPVLELAPLPASAQFLNVIESVFSGMARSIIHGSDYESKAAAQSAMDSHFKARNEHFQAHPQRAGKKIWGKERVAADFNESNNCKDPAYR